MQDRIVKIHEKIEELDDQIGKFYDSIDELEDKLEEADEVQG